MYDKPCEIKKNSESQEMLKKISLLRSKVDETVGQVYAMKERLFGIEAEQPAKEVEVKSPDSFFGFLNNTINRINEQMDKITNLIRTI